MIPNHKSLTCYFEKNNLATQFICDNAIFLPITSCPEDSCTLEKFCFFKFKCSKKTHKIMYLALLDTVLQNLK